MDIGLAGFILTAIAWISREIWRWQKARGLAIEKAIKDLKEKKALLEERISKTQDASSRGQLDTQLDDMDAELLGLYSESLRRALKEAGYPPEERLIADGRRQLQPQQAAHLEQLTAEVEALPPFPWTRDLFVLGNAYYHIQKYEDAKNIYDKILKLNPDDLATLNNRGVTYAKLGKYDEALADYNRSLELRPDDPATLYNRGNTYAKLGRYVEALADYNRSLELRPNDPDALYNLSCLFSLWEKTDKALEYLKKA
ncbi:MAG: tetratricopeptide repeat protein, partial [Dehalococcoidales bacterium]|nr:tetratricopeptide repeat protein [Dehalococcoidales bacterium]